MKVFRELAEVEAIEDPVIREVVRQQLQTLIGGLASAGHAYDPETDGYVVLVEPGDGEAEALAEFGVPFTAIGWEGAWWANRQVLCGVTLSNNQFGRTVVVPDRFGVDAGLRRALRDELPDDAGGRRR